MTSSRWTFWIDAGGTFTDCIARRPDGTLLRHKLLSSGVIKGTVAAGSSESRIIDPRRAVDSPGHWQGYTLALVDRQGNTIDQATVARFSIVDAATEEVHNERVGLLELGRPLRTRPQPGALYELHSDEEAPVVAVRYLMDLKRHDTIPPVTLRLGSTRGTNALITRSGARTALVTTRGFGDVLAIGYQDRPKLFALNIQKPQPLYTRVFEVDERVTFDGEVLLAPDEDAVRRGLAQLKADDIQSLAVCLLHSHAFPQHEQSIGRWARELGFNEISLSSDVAPLVKIVSRGDTTTVDAYLNPVLRRYVESLRRSLPRSDLKILTSAGGLVAAEHFVGKDSLLSGPAGGVVGFSHAAQAAGFPRAIGLDMGGTSSDVARFDGRYELQFETQKAGVRIVAPMMAIETVAAGGGSLCRFDGVKLTVGPESAGADPGPACYGRGGPLTVTDMNFFLGRLPPDRFPFPLDRQPVEDQLRALASTIHQATSRHFTPAELADGFLRIADANMAKAIESISVAKGADPRDYVLVSFGGAAPQHACQVARLLGIRTVLNHPDNGILSARGIGLAPIVRHRVVGVYQPLSAESLAAAEQSMEQLAREAREQVQSEGVADSDIRIDQTLELRYQGQEAALEVRCPADHDYATAFAALHEQRYGYQYAERPLEIVAAHVSASGSTEQHLPESKSCKPLRPRPVDALEVWFDAQPRQTDVFDRELLTPGDRILGPAIVREAISTTVIEPGWQVEVLSQGELVLTDTGAISAGHARADGKTASADVDPVSLEIFNNRFAGIAERMGITLRNTASSVNVKERLDFSCAIFTAEGHLVVNAPHIPVHLGAMGETVRSVIAHHSPLCPGDVIITNDPFRGGSHLPDVTVVTPVHDERDGRLLFFTASRAHHAEIGGTRPGSMPPFSKNLVEEGVLIRSFKLVEGGLSHEARSREDELRRLLTTAPYPSRAVDDNLADVAAQVAANRQGARELIDLVAEQSLPVVAAHMHHIQTAAEQKTRQALARLKPGQHTFTDHLDDGSAITATLTVLSDATGRKDSPQVADHTKSLVIDFTGTSPVHAGNLNANRAIVTAAVIYSLRLLLDEDIPLNEGVLQPVEIILPVGLLNPPAAESAEECAAVVGGNVETSQRVVDVLLGALRLAAASQGTMNNLLFGDDSFGYYETICGGAGATATADGADAVHTHMTNTRITDPEVMERRYPVRVREFSIRRGSGGAGRRRGGDGVVRRIEFLRPLEVSILSQRRGPYAPYGLDGGQAGQLGRNLLERADGSLEELPACTQFVAQPGDILTIETPGGGGCGTP